MDPREDRHENPLVWNHASNGAQPPMRPLDAENLKPMGAMPSMRRPPAPTGQPLGAPGLQPMSAPGLQPIPAPALQPMSAPALQPMPAWAPEARPTMPAPARPVTPPASAPEPWINTPAPQPVPTQAGLRQPQPVPAWQPTPSGRADAGGAPAPAPVTRPPQPVQEAPVRRILTQTVPRTVPLEDAEGNPAAASSAPGARMAQAVPAYDPTRASGVAGTRFSYENEPSSADMTLQGRETPRHRRVRTPSPASALNSADEENEFEAGIEAARWTQEEPTPPPSTRGPTARGYAYPIPPTPQGQPSASAPLPQGGSPQPVAWQTLDAQVPGQPRPQPQEQGQPIRRETAGLQPAWRSAPAAQEPSAYNPTQPTQPTQSTQPGELQWQLPQASAPAIPLTANWTSQKADAPSRSLDAPTPTANAYPLPQMTGGFSADALDEDSGRYDAVIHPPLAEPVPVPTFGRESRARGKRRFGPMGIALAVIVLLAAGAYALYSTGLLTQWTQSLFPSTTAGDTVPAVFQQETAQQTAITPATQVDKVEQFSVSVEPQSAAVPASLVFTVRTNTAVTAIRLLTESGTVIRTNASYFRQEDALVWQVSATIETAYTGKVRVFLRDAAGGWSEGGQDCQITVQ